MSLLKMPKICVFRLKNICNDHQGTDFAHSLPNNSDALIKNFAYRDHRADEQGVRTKFVFYQLLGAHAWFRNNRYLRCLTYVCRQCTLK